MAGRKDNKGRVLKSGKSQRKDGTYDFRYTEHGKRKSFYAKTLQELREKEKQLSKNNLLGISAAGGNMTLNEMFEIYMESKQVRDSTIVTQRGTWQYNVADAIGNIRICNLRHTAASLMVSKEMNIASVSKILGHSDIATTLNTYTHSTEGQEKAEVEKLDNAINF